MTWNEFFQSVKSGQLNSVYLFSGPEEWIKQEALEALRAQLLPPGLEQLNDIVLEGCTAQQIIDAAETMPMMCDRRIVTVRDWAPLLPGKSKNEEEEADRIVKWLDNPPDTCVTVFYLRSEPDGRKKAVTQMKKKATPIVFDYLTDSELAKWASKRLKPLGKKISSNAVNTLIFMAGKELTRLAGEIDKLAAFVEDRTEISENDVKEIVAASLEYNIFELLNRLLEGDMAEAQRMTNSLLQGGQTAIGILAMLSRQLRQLAHVRYSSDAKEPLQRIQELLKLNPYAAKKIAQQCKARPAEVFRALYEHCVQLDYDIKSGRLRDSAALDSVLLKIAATKLANGRN